MLNFYHAFINSAGVNNISTSPNCNKLWVDKIPLGSGVTLWHRPKPIKCLWWELSHCFSNSSYALTHYDHMDVLVLVVSNTWQSWPVHHKMQHRPPCQMLVHLHRCTQSMGWTEFFYISNTIRKRHFFQVPVKEKKILEKSSWRNTFTCETVHPNHETDQFCIRTSTIICSLWPWGKHQKCSIHKQACMYACLWVYYLPVQHSATGHLRYKNKSKL